MTDDEQAGKLQALRIDSDALMDALDDMKRTEGKKRRQHVSTPEFHQLAQDVEEKSRRVYRLAKGENDIAESTETTNQTIEETRRVNPRIA